MPFYVLLPSFLTDVLPAVSVLNSKIIKRVQVAIATGGKFYADVEISGIKTTSLAIVQRRTAFDNTSGAYIVGCRCDTDGTLRVYFNKECSGTYAVTVMYTG